jgi:hypothetical protein
MNSAKCKNTILLLAALLLCPASFAASFAPAQEGSHVTGEDDGGEAQIQAKLHKMVGAEEADDYMHNPDGSLFYLPDDKTHLPVRKEVREVIPRVTARKDTHAQAGAWENLLSGNCQFLNGYHPEDEKVSLYTSIKNRMGSQFQRDRMRTALDQASLACEQRDVIHSQEGTLGVDPKTKIQIRPKRVAEYVADLRSDALLEIATSRDFLEFLDKAIAQTQDINPETLKVAGDNAAKQSLLATLSFQKPNQAQCVQDLQQLKREIKADYDQALKSLAGQVADLKIRCPEVKSAFKPRQ